MDHANRLKGRTMRVYSEPMKTLDVALIILVSNGQGRESILNRQQQGLLCLGYWLLSSPFLPPPTFPSFLSFCLHPFLHFFPSYLLSLSPPIMYPGMGINSAYDLGWFWISKEKHKLEFLALLPPPPECCHYRIMQSIVSLCSTGDGNHSFMHARQALYPLRYIPNSIYPFPIHSNTY